MCDTLCGGERSRFRCWSSMPPAHVRTWSNSATYGEMDGQRDWLPSSKLWGCCRVVLITTTPVTCATSCWVRNKSSNNSNKEQLVRENRTNQFSDGKCLRCASFLSNPQNTCITAHVSTTAHTARERAVSFHSLSPQEPQHSFHTSCTTNHPYLDDAEGGSCDGVGEVSTRWGHGAHHSHAALSVRTVHKARGGRKKWVDSARHMHS